MPKNLAGLSAPVIIGVIAALYGFYAYPATAQTLALPPGYDAKARPPVIASPPAIPPPGADNYGQTPAMPAIGYFPILPFEAGDNPTPALLPVASNHALEGDHAKITSALIAIHDATRDASAMLGLMTALAGGANESTMIVVPQFLLESDIAAFADRLPEEGRNLPRWPMDGWQNGGNSTAQPPQKGISSFTAIDLLMIYFGDKQFFPNLKNIVIAGSGAGGDFVLRYAAAGQAPDLLEPQGIDIRFAAANPSSYVYFTPLRPFTGKQGFTMPDAAKCPGYDAYQYGLNDLNAYARRAGASAIRLRYAARHVTYLSGERTSVADRFPDNSCAALLQGPDRLSRAKNYALYINVIFGDDAAPSQKFVIVPKAGYEPAAMFGSRCGMATLFGDGQCDEAPITGVGIQQ